MKDAKRIARNMSSRQRWALVDLGYGYHAPGWPVFLLILKGLVTFRRRWFLFGEKDVFITRLGWRVRQHIVEGEA